MKNEIIIYDIEFTAWEGSIDRDWSLDWEEKEIIQIGMAVYNFKYRKVVDTLNIEVKPVINPILSDYIKELTKITQEQVDNAFSFKEVIEEFKKFTKSRQCFSWGNDVFIMNENMILNNLEKLDESKHFDLGEFLIPLNEKLNTNSGNLISVMGMENKIYGNQHNALYDVLSQAHTLSYYLEDDKKLKDFKRKFNLK